MKARLIWLLAIPALIACFVCKNTPAEEATADDPKEEAAIFKNAEAFVEAFHKGDAKAVAAFWTKDGDYTDQTGKTMKGRDAIEKAFTEFFAENKGLKLRIDVDGLKFVTPEVALEDGVTSVIPPDGGPPSRARYTIIHVKKDGKWQLSSVRDAPFAPPTNQEHFRGLEWLIGDWAAESDKGETARVSFTYTDDQNFMNSTFTTTFKNIAIGGGTQWIGWDPSAKTIRSWTFETSGGFGEGTWTPDGNKWIVKATGVIRDGKKLAATNVLTRIDDDTMSWESKDRTEDGKSLPDIKPIKMKRAK
jgi:uncharacterized protein (TIGR02246 family)